MKLRRVINCSRVDDLRKEAETYNAKRSEAEKMRNSEVLEYHKAVSLLTNRIEEAILANLASCNTQDVNININQRFGDGFEIIINNGENPHNESQGLSWNWKVSVDYDGNIKKDSGSWSGLKAITKEQINDLRNTVEILSLLNDMNWKDIFDVIKENYPEYEDYIKTQVPKMRNFDKEIEEAEIAECVGNMNVAIEGEKGYSRYFTVMRPFYYIILKETPTQYKVQEVSFNNADNTDEEVTVDYNIKKDKFYSCIKRPLNIIEI